MERESRESDAMPLRGGRGIRRCAPGAWLALCLACLVLTPPVLAASPTPSTVHHPRHHPVGHRPSGARAHAAIVGGNQVPTTQAPWQVAVLANTGKGQILCGGSILDPTHVLTAAHCTETEAEGPIPLEDLEVIAGTSDLSRTKAEEPTRQDATVEAVRIHPFYVPGGDQDDVAVLELEAPLDLGEPAVQALEMVPAPSLLTEGTAVNLTGFGMQSYSPPELDQKLHSLAMTLAFSRRCGGEADAVFLCASSASGSACLGDSGSALTATGSGELAGVMDDIELIGGEPCVRGSLNYLTDLGAPEIRSFIEGSESPPRAPRGGGVSVEAVPQAGNPATCSPGSWSGSPTYTYVFLDTSTGQVLQSGPAQVHQLTAADVGRTISCMVEATNAGGTGLGRTIALPPIQPASVPPPTPEVHTSEAPPAPSSPVAPVQVNPTPVTRCLVPSLAHKSLQAARTALAKAHCRLGRVTRPHARHHTLVVVAQAPARGRQLAVGTRVAVRLGTVKHRHR